MHLLCPLCQTAIEVADLRSAEELTCPSCGSTFRIHPDSTRTWSPPDGRRSFGPYELIERVGAGSFGTVYKAHDTRLDRMVAVKVPRAGSLAGPEDRDRFLREARSLAQLRHPAIVSVHDVGEHDGTPYIVNDFVDGVTLADLLSARRPDFRAAARLVIEVADALQFAHGLGVVHRDVKPSNILIDGAGRPHVADFGLSRRDAGEVTMTFDGQVLGTPAYMSPEQARGEGHRVDGRGDVYSLGVVLYQLLTGELPFRGTARMLLHQVLRDEPKPPRRLNDRIPRDMETVCLKAMAKEPARRYQSARELAEDLGRFLAGEPIRARPAGPAERLMRRVRRNPVQSALAGAVLVLLGLLSAGAFAYGLEQRRIAERQTRLADERTAFGKEKALAERRTAASLYQARLGQAEALRLARSPGYRARVWGYLREAASLEVPGRDPGRIGELALACLGDPIGLEPLTGPHAGNLSPALPPQGTEISKVVGIVRTSSPDGRLSAEAGRGTITVKSADGRLLGNSASRLGPVRDLEFGPAGALLVAGCEEGVGVWESPGMTPRSFYRGEVVTEISVHPWGHLVAANYSGKRAEIWSLDSNRLITWIAPAPPLTRSFRFTADGRHLLAVAEGGKVLSAWSVAGTPEKLSLGGHRGGVAGVAYSPDGLLLASCSKDRTVKLWDARSGSLLRDLAGHEVEVQTVAFSPDGRMLASGDWDGVIRLWDVRTGGPLGRRKADSIVRVWRVRFDPLGRYMAAAGDRGVALWAVDPGTTVVAPEPFQSFGQYAGAYDLAVVDDGSVAAVVNRNQDVRLYDVARARGPYDLDVTAAAQVQSIGFEPGTGRLRFVESGGGIGGWDPSTGPLPSLRRLPGRNSLALSPDGRLAASSDHSTNRMVIDDLAGDRTWSALPAETSRPWSWDWSPDGSRLAVGLSDGGLVVWHLEEVRARLAEFGIALPSTLGHRPASHAGSGRPGVEAVVRRHARLGEVRDLLDEFEGLLDGGRKDEAYRVFLRAGSLAAGEPVACREVGQQGLRHGAFPEAEALLLRAVAPWNGSPPVPPAGIFDRTELAASEGLLGDLYAAQGLWPEAARAYALRLDQGRPVGVPERHHHAVAALLVGDDATYRKVVRLPFDPDADEATLEANARIARVGSLADSEPAEAARLVGVAENTVAEYSNSPHGWHHYTLGLALYRAGRFGKAVEVLERVPARDPAWTGAPMTWPVLAMAHQGQGRREEALRWLDRAERWRDEELRRCLPADRFRVPLSPYWWDWADFELLRREAWSRVGGDPDPDDPAGRAMRARALAELGHDDEAARASIDAVLASAVGLPELRVGVGLADVRHGRVERAVERAPDSPDVLLAAGRAQRKGGRLDQAEVLLLRAAGLIEAGAVGPARALASALGSLGLDREGRGDLPGALRAWERGAEILEARFNVATSDTECRYELARALTHVGHLRTRVGPAASAVSAHGRAHEILKGLGFYLRLRAHDEARIGASHAAGGRQALAREFWRLGRSHLEAVVDPGPVDLYLLACFDATESRLGDVGRGSPSPGEPADDRSLADRAVAGLRRAIDAGLDHPEFLRDDPDLDPLRARPDFQALIADALFPADPFAP